MYGRPSVVLVTGVGRYLGGRIAARLAADPEVRRVIGIDTVPPVHVPLGAAEFVRADVRHPMLVTILAQARVDTVVHTTIDAVSDVTVAVERSPGVRRVVARSSAAVYGFGARTPAVRTEDLPTRPPHDTAEEPLRALARHRPDVTVSLLRLAEVVGPGVDSSLVRHLASAPALPALTPLGYDRPVQVVHEIDAVEVFGLAATSDHPGPTNVAGDGVLTYNQAVRKVGRLRLGVPSRVFGADAALQRFGCVLDTARLAGEFGFVPRFTTAEALRTCLPLRRSLPAAAVGIAERLVQVVST